MTLKEYLNQKDPQRMPTVILKKTDYSEITNSLNTIKFIQFILI